MVILPQARLRILVALMMIMMISFGGCDKSDVKAPHVVIDTGTADFTRYVAIGNSLTAGFQSNALSDRDQVYAYPNLIAQQVRADFQMPLMKDPGIGNRIRLKDLAPTLVSES